jgi:uncharacterized protein (TIGR00369 family)
MDNEDFIALLNQRAPEFIRMLGGRVAAVDRQERTCTFEFNISTEFCHSVNVVQGGFITAMLDAAMSHALLTSTEGVGSVSSLEIKTSYLEPTLAGRLRVVGTVVKSGYKLAFLEGRLYNDEGLLTATTSSVAKLIRRG